MHVQAPHSQMSMQAQACAHSPMEPKDESIRVLSSADGPFVLDGAVSTCSQHADGAAGI